jgi:beta-aspartyl-dipeptidase (metallo-type)
VFDDKGILVGLTVASQKSLLANFRFVVQENVLAFEKAIGLFATTPADFYKLEHKGRIEEGLDADLILLDGDLSLTDSFIKGHRLMADKQLLSRGTFSSRSKEK